MYLRYYTFAWYTIMTFRTQDIDTNFALSCFAVVLLIALHISRDHFINTLRPRQNGRHFADDIFKCIFVNENVWIRIKISLKFVHQGQIDNIPSLVQIMAWRRPGDKPLSEPMIVSLLTHICLTRHFLWTDFCTRCEYYIKPDYNKYSGGTISYFRLSHSAWNTNGNRELKHIDDMTRRHFPHHLFFVSGIHGWTPFTKDQ